MDEVLADTLQTSITGHLDYLDRLVLHGDDPSKRAVIEGEFLRLTNTIRGLLDEHRQDPRNGSCSVCSGRWRRRSCSILTVAHHRLLADDDPTGSGSGGRHARENRRTVSPERPSALRVS